MSYVIERFVTGPIETNTYVVSNGLAALVIDPSSNCAKVLKYLGEKNTSVAAILLTHGHFDHILGISEIQAVFPNAKVWVNPAERPLLQSPEFNGSYLIGKPLSYTGGMQELPEGPLTIEGISFLVAYVPGHSPGGSAFIFAEDGETAHCISGDSLFAGSIGRTDFPMGDGGLLIKNIVEKLLTLPDETVVYPGHGNRTTIGREKRLNPYLSQG